MGRLTPEEWRSGRNHVIVDFVSPFAGGKWAEK
jgi:hemolysin-activating ACP:hemolysin acyltransferase